MPIEYFLASIVSFLGLLLGTILIKLAPEEQKPGKKYFILFKKILLFLIITIFFIKINIIILVLLLITLSLFLINKKITLKNTALIYLLFGVLFSLSFITQNLFTIESVLIFLYGIPTASLIFNIKKKNYKDVFDKNLLFFVPVIALYFIL